LEKLLELVFSTSGREHQPILQHFPLHHHENLRLDFSHVRHYWLPFLTLFLGGFTVSFLLLRQKIVYLRWKKKGVFWWGLAPLKNAMRCQCGTTEMFIIGESAPQNKDFFSWIPTPFQTCKRL
jgi:hypothetical protein